jgi:hypothetical protein
MERKRAVLFMMKVLELNERLKKAGGKTNRSMLPAGFGESPCGFGSSMG